MQQAWHILKKDIRFLYREIIALLLLAVIFGWMARAAARNGDFAEAIEVLYAVAVAYTIGRLVHAEAIPGVNQFWITRPYRWMSLLTAKIMFLIAFVHLPVLVTQVSILLVEGFPVGAILPGLLWCQVLILLALSLPCFALAAVTPGLISLIASLLVFLVIGFVAIQSRYQSLFVYAPESIEWIRYSIPLATVAIAMPPVLFMQYKTRQTRRSELFAGAVTLCGAIAFMFLPWTTLFSVQSLLSRESIPLELKRVPTPVGPHMAFDALPQIANRMSIYLHLRLAGVPPGMRAQVDRYDSELQIGTLRAPLGVIAGRLGLSHAKDDPNELILFGDAIPNIMPLASLRGKTGTLRVSFFFVLFGNKRDMTIPFQSTPVNALDGMRCRDGYFDEIVCNAPFRWPGTYVSVKTPWGGLTPFTHLISYSPFPAMLELNPVAERSAGPHWSKDKRSSREVTIEVEEPLAYLRRDIEVANFSLGAR